MSQGRPIYRLPPIRYGQKIFLAEDVNQIVDWGQANINVPRAQKVSRGAGIKVGVADTGQPDHPDVVAQIAAGQNFSSSPDVMDHQGHSTHVCGILAANGKILGAAPQCQIWIAKVLGDDGSGGNDAVAAGINWLVSQGVDIISASLGGPFDETLAAAVYAAMDAGVLCVFAAGNDGPGNTPSSDTVGYPARLPVDPKGERPVAVASYNKSGNLSDFSSRGPEVTCAFPGEDILSTWLNGGYRQLSGTSMATPLCSGVTALLRSYEKAQVAAGTPPPSQITSNASLIDRLKATAVDVGAPGFDPGWGWGKIDAFKFVESDTPQAPAPVPLGGDLLKGVHYTPAKMNGKVGAFVWAD